MLACDLISFSLLILMNRIKEKAEQRQRDIVSGVVRSFRIQIKCKSTVTVSMYFILTVYC